MPSTSKLYDAVARGCRNQREYHEAITILDSILAEQRKLKRLLKEMRGILYEAANDIAPAPAQTATQRTVACDIDYTPTSYSRPFRRAK